MDSDEMVEALRGPRGDIHNVIYWANQEAQRTSDLGMQAVYENVGKLADAVSEMIEVLAAVKD